jgi:hypothetical protein
MSKTNQRVARTPAAKLPHLHKKMRNNKTQAQKARKK